MYILYSCNINIKQNFIKYKFYCTMLVRYSNESACINTAIQVKHVYSTYSLCTIRDLILTPQDEPRINS